VPVERIELPTFGLQNRCSTAELNRLIGESDKLYFIADARRNRRLVAGSGAVKYQSCRTRAIVVGKAALGLAVLQAVFPVDRFPIDIRKQAAFGLRKVEIYRP
jgi:hypothetical protein